MIKILLVDVYCKILIYNLYDKKANVLRNMPSVRLALTFNLRVQKVLVR